MTDNPPSSENKNGRKIKVHRKSRLGCGNCKLRSVKCDETKPSCKRCIAYGVLCNYDCKNSNLQLSVAGASGIKVLEESFDMLNETIPRTITPKVGQVSMGSLGANADLGMLSKFRERTVFTISAGEGLRLYQDEIVQQACTHAFLMHTVLTLTLMHDRNLSGPLINTKSSAIEAYHWYHSMALFNRKLSGTVAPFERDALCATAALLGVIAFSYIEATRPEEAWPLRPPSTLDLDWLKLSDGKKEVWKIASPSRVASMYEALAHHMDPSSSTTHGLDGLPSNFIVLCGLDTVSSTVTNPYRAAAFSLAKSLSAEAEMSIVFGFGVFIGSMEPAYRYLLEQKDPCALLILAYRYAQVCPYRHWWMWRRAVLECQAICIYLGKYYQQEHDLQELLFYPRAMCGLGTC